MTTNNPDDKTFTEHLLWFVAKVIMVMFISWPATYAWNLGLVPAIEGVHLIDYWQMFYIACLILFLQGKL